MHNSPSANDRKKSSSGKSLPGHLLINSSRPRCFCGLRLNKKGLIDWRRWEGLRELLCGKRTWVFCCFQFVSRISSCSWWPVWPKTGRCWRWTNSSNWMRWGKCIFQHPRPLGLSSYDFISSTQSSPCFCRSFISWLATAPIIISNDVCASRPARSRWSSSWKKDAESSFLKLHIANMEGISYSICTGSVARISARSRATPMISTTHTGSERFVGGTLGWMRSRNILCWEAEPMRRGDDDPRCGQGLRLWFKSTWNQSEHFTSILRCFQYVEIWWWGLGSGGNSQICFHFDIYFYIAMQDLMKAERKRQQQKQQAVAPGVGRTAWANWTWNPVVFLVGTNLPPGDVYWAAEVRESPQPRFRVWLTPGAMGQRSQSMIIVWSWWFNVYAQRGNVCGGEFACSFAARKCWSKRMATRSTFRRPPRWLPPP